jgi:hypothetical protein
VSAWHCADRLEDRTLLATFTVTNTMDSGAGSLRQAMLDANAVAGADTIEFAVPATDGGHVYYQDDGIAGQVTLANVATTTEADDASIADIDPDWAHSWFSIQPTGPLPQISEVVAIDGYSQAGASANTNPAGQGLNTVLKIEINGASAGQVEFGLLGVGLNFADTGAGGTTIRGLVLNRSQGPKVNFEFFAPGNRVEGSFLGPDVSGTLAFAPPVVDPLPAFLRSNGVFASSGGHTIGGTTADTRNLISGNNFVTTSLDAAVALRGFSGPTLVQSNLIGTDRTGTLALGNVGGGVLIDSPGNTIAENVISASPVGVLASSGNASATLITGNWIGTDVTGTLDLGNAGAGIAFGFGDGNQVTLNTIAFNQTGVSVGSSATGNLVSRNSIFSNDQLGIDLFGPFGLGSVDDNDVPPASDPPDQDTGGNNVQNHPVLSAVTDIGAQTRIAGTLTSTPDSSFRIELFASTERDENAIRLFGVPGEFGEGQTYLGSVDVTTDASGGASFSVDLPVDLLSLPGPGGQPFVTATATDITDPGTGPLNDTSEFSPVAPLGGPSFVVTSTGDTGLGTLREAIINANLTPGLQTVTFNIPAHDPRHFYYADDGVAGQVSFVNTSVTTETDDATISGIDPDWTHSWFGIILDTALPLIIDPVTIDGYSQAGAMQNTLTFDDEQGLNTVLKIELDGRNVAGDGFSLGSNGLISDAGGSVIRGFAINAFGGDGIQVNTLGGGNTIAGNFIGSDISGTLNFGNGGNGVFLVIDNDDVIGGPDAADRNLISGNVGNGILVVSSLRTLIQGNVLGGDRTLETFFETSGSAIQISDDGSLVRSGAIVVNSDAEGGGSLKSLAAAVTGDRKMELLNAILGLFGTRSNLPALVHIVDRLEDGKPTPQIEFVQLAYKLFDALQQLTPKVGANPQASANTTAPAATISSTVITAVDLGSDGVTPNDPLDADDGPNGLQNYPVLTSAVTDAGVTTVNGTLHSVPTTSFRIEIYSSSYDTRTVRAGERSLGTVNVTTDAAGNAAFTFVAPEVVPLGHDVISLATRLEDGTLEPIETSEFSAGLEVTDGQPPAPVRHDLLGLRTSDGRFEAQESTGTQFTLDSDYGPLDPAAGLGDHRVGDFNGDGLDDVAARNSATGDVIVPLSDGTQMVPSTWTTWSLNATWKHVAVGDFNRDGMDDLVGLAGSGTVLVSLSNGVGFDNAGFGAVSGVADWVNLFAGDVNNDGFHDIVLRSSTGAWVVGLSDGSRFTFSLFGRWSSTVNWQDVQTADFNGDGCLDVVGRSPSGKVVVGLSDGTRFGFSVFSTWSTLVDWETMIGDFNGDGSDDILARASTGTIVMNLSTGTGFSRSVSGSLSTAVNWLFFIGDFDADGDDDLAGIASTGTIAVGLSTGSTFNVSVWGVWLNRDSRAPYFVGNFVGDS